MAMNYHPMAITLTQYSTRKKQRLKLIIWVSCNIRHDLQKFQITVLQYALESIEALLSTLALVESVLKFKNGVETRRAMK